MSGCERSNCLGQTCLEAPNPCNTRPHAVEFSIRQIHLLWIDEEDQSALVDPVEVEDFPTILIASREHPLFFGTVLPNIQALQPLIEARLGGDSKPLRGHDEVHDLAARLWAVADAAA